MITVSSSALSWRIVIVIGMLLGGATFLGYEHVMNGDFVATIYGSVASGAIVGHFATQGNANG